MPSTSIFAISIAKIRKSREKQKEKVENLCLCEEEYIPLRQIQLYLFMKIFSILTRKYPYPQNRLWLRDSAVYCTIVFLILYLLQPFGFSMYHGNKLLVSLLFGIVTFACCYIFGLVFVPLQKRISPWRIWHEVCSTLVMILCIYLCNLLVFFFVFHYPINLEFCLLSFYWTLIVGLVITVISVSVSYSRHLRNELASMLNKNTEEQADIQVTIHDTAVRSKDLTIGINDFLYAEAQKNNVVIYYLSEGQVMSTELRCTLGSILEDLSYGNIFQCHRSFIVNMNNISSAKGNSNGYQLMLGNCRNQVPVSRTYVPKLKSFIA